MSFIKSYWWVFALVIGAFLIYWFMFRKPAVKTAVSTLPPKLNPACPLSVQEWLDKVAAKEAQIRADSRWLNNISTNQVGTGTGKWPTLAAAVTANALYALETVDGLCNPTKAPVA